jgi:hypothetical protein
VTCLSSQSKLDERLRARLWGYLDQRCDAIAQTLLAQVPDAMRANRAVLEGIEADATDTAIREVKARFLADRTFAKQFYLDA